ncbi:MAG: Fe-S cluster protein [Desulfobulbus sp.]|nr:MAG: Fe-S cluster protein [Desulfobulbus sp.]RUM36269.1 MAG: Fe-S cluster protein [Desulfobulbus sp.]
MTPHQFLAYIPATNCGECGYPACLAFAVAVTKGGVSPTLCPYVALEKLPDDLVPDRGETGLGAVERGQQERDMALVTHLKSKVRELDFQSLAVRLGAVWQESSPDELIFSCLGRQVNLSRDDVAINGQQLVDPRDQILLYNYVAFGGGRVPDDNWVGMESLPNSISKIRTLATYCELRLAGRFSGRAGVLAELCEKIGGRAGAGDQSADVGMIIPVLPYVPHYLLFWDEEPEDGFEAKVKVLFDHNVMDFLDLESLVFAAERMADRLAELDC